MTRLDRKVTRVRAGGKAQCSQLGKNQDPKCASRSGKESSVLSTLSPAALFTLLSLVWCGVE